MKPSKLDEYLTTIRRCFLSRDRREAHRAAAPVLDKMARDSEVLADVIRKNLSTAGFLERQRINPVLAMEIDKQPDFDFIMHGWMPLPDRSTELSHQSIHHHGNLLLSSVAPFGPGYDSILFRPDFQIHPETLVTEMQVARYYSNQLYNLEFIESNTPHIVFYPPSVSITYALWCSEKASSAAGLKSLKLVQRYKKQVKSLLEAAGLARAAGLNVISFFDFYLKNGSVLAMKERINYQPGSSENFQQNLFHFLQQVGFSDRDFVKRLGPVRNRWQEQFIEGEPIEDLFSPNHLSVDKVNIPRQHLLERFGLKAPA